MLLEGRVAVVTGGARGIGRAIAGLFYKEGARVAIVSRDTKSLQAVSMEVNQGDHRIVPFRCDVTDADSVEVMVGNVVEVWDRVDILVNNAGTSGMTPIDPGDTPGAREAVEKKWHEILATNLTGLFHCTREVARHLPDGGTGRILNLSSVLGKFGVPGYAAYCASKHGVIGFTRALALELAPRKITVNALCPGWVTTDMATQGIEENSRRLGIPAEEFRRQAEARVPLGRFIEPEEVARLALFLASDQGKGITGQSINLDGGAAMW
jgi:NAD(P)-dependent dehydrogenase (short-subunit alcohol dehydrogenase family)